MDSSHPTRVPQLWILLPFSLGIAAVHFGDAESYHLWLALSDDLISISLYCLRISKIVWHLAFASSLIAAGVGYFSLLEDKRHVRTELPPREAILEFKVQRLFKSSDEKLKGIGSIQGSHPHLSDLKDAKIYFSLLSEDNHDSVLPNDLIRARGVLTTEKSVDSSSSFHQFLDTIGVSAKFDRGIVLSFQEPIGFLSSLQRKIKLSAETSLSAGLDKEASHARAYRAMILGEKQLLEEEQRLTFLRNGAMHIFAISGLHIGVIAVCGHSLLSLLRVPRKWIFLPNLVIIYFFVTSTGGAPSAWRALNMIACFYLCLNTKRQVSPINALALSALICLLVDPRQLFSAGFQLSYCAVASILLYGIPLANKLNSTIRPFSYIPQRAWNWRHKRINNCIRFLNTGFAVSLAAFMTSSILGMLYFQTLPLTGVLANLLMLPLASLAIVSGFISIFLGFAGLLFLCSLFNHAAGLIISIMEWVLQSIAKIEGSFIETGPPDTLLAMTLLVSIFVLVAWGYSKAWRIRLGWMLSIGAVSYAANLIIASTS